MFTLHTFHFPLSLHTSTLQYSHDPQYVIDRFIHSTLKSRDDTATDRFLVSWSRLGTNREGRRIKGFRCLDCECELLFWGAAVGVCVL